MEHKPDNRCELQTACCGESGIMLQSKLVKTAKAREREGHDLDDEGLNERTRVLEELCALWAGSNRVVIADLYFGLVQTANELCKIGLCFTGIVKMATRQFPMHELQLQQLNNQGDHKSMWSTTTDTAKPDLMTFAWVDRERRHFVSLCSNL